jgi:Fe2+ transport system protein B
MAPQWLGTFVQGMSAMACVVISLFFVQFWRKTADRLFLIFAISFGLMCVTRVVATAIVATAAAAQNTLAEGQVHTGTVYLIRFLAYLLILVAIVDKNR